MLVFRSVVIPLISIMDVGIAMVVALSLVMNLAKWWGLSHFRLHPGLFGDHLVWDRNGLQHPFIRSL